MQYSIHYQEKLSQCHIMVPIGHLITVSICEIDFNTDNSLLK